MADGKETTEKEPLQLDSKSLEAIIDGVAAKLREECTRKPGEHSGSVTASTSGGNGERDTELPKEKDLLGAGVGTFEAGGGHSQEQSAKEQISKLLSKLDGSESNGEATPHTPIVSMGAGLSAISKKLAAKILSNEYVDFAELPPAKGKGRPMPQSLEGQIIVVQAADLIQARKIIPDFATWVQCFSLYVATLATKFPERIPDLMAYQTTIAKASQKYQWPSWVVYDQNFRQEAADNPTQSWAKVDPSIYAQCFTGQAISAENWCSKCQCLDHTSANCPYRQRKRPWNTAMGAGANQFPGKAGPEPPVCIKFNKFNGDRKFGRECRFLHVCSSCKEAHPVSRCPKSANGSATAPGQGVPS